MGLNEDLGDRENVGSASLAVARRAEAFKKAFSNWRGNVEGMLHRNLTIEELPEAKHAFNTGCSPSQYCQNMTLREVEVEEPEKST